MRWSLILSTFITFLFVFSFVSHALPVARSSSVELEPRGRSKAAPSKAQPRKQSSRAKTVQLIKDSHKVSNIKASSKVYRESGVYHPDAYVFHGDQVNRVALHPGSTHGKETIKTPGIHADHVYEAQTFNKVLRQNSLHLHELPPALQKEAHDIINGPKNVALVPAGVNMGKGQVFKHAMDGKAIEPVPKRDNYIHASHPTAKANGEALDKAFHEHDVRLNQDSTFSQVLHKAMQVHNAGKQNS